MYSVECTERKYSTRQNYTNILYFSAKIDNFEKVYDIQNEFLEKRESLSELTKILGLAIFEHKNTVFKVVEEISLKMVVNNFEPSIYPVFLLVQTEIPFFLKFHFGYHRSRLR